MHIAQAGLVTFAQFMLLKTAMHEDMWLSVYIVQTPECHVCQGVCASQLGLHSYLHLHAQVQPSS